MKIFRFVEGNSFAGHVVGKARLPFGGKVLTHALVRLTRECDTTVEGIKAHEGEKIAVRIVRTMRRKLRLRDQVEAFVGTPFTAGNGRQLINIDLRIKRWRDHRGRPVGWRKKDAMRKSIMVRLPADAAAWLRSTAWKMKIPQGRIVRGLINSFVAREAVVREIMKGREK